MKVDLKILKNQNMDLKLGDVSYIVDLLMVKEVMVLTAVDLYLGYF